MFMSNSVREARSFAGGSDREDGLSGERLEIEVVILNHHEAVDL